MVWSLKVDTEGKPVLKDNLPVFVKADNSEQAFDAEKQYETVGRLMGEAKTFREGKEAAESTLVAYKGLEPTKVADALKALETVKNLSAGELKTAEQVETVRKETEKALKAQYEPVVAEVSTLKSQITKMTIGQNFSGSKFVTDKVAVPADMLQAMFGQNFEVKEGKLIAKLGGNELYSKSNPGNLAGFDEALEMMIEAYPQREHILKGSGANGGGGSGGGNRTQMVGGKPTMLRTAFEALDPAARAASVKTHVIVD